MAVTSEKGYADIILTCHVGYIKKIATGQNDGKHKPTKSAVFLNKTQVVPSGVYSMQLCVNERMGCTVHFTQVLKLVFCKWRSETKISSLFQLI